MCETYKYNKEPTETNNRKVGNKSYLVNICLYFLVRFETAFINDP